MKTRLPKVLRSAPFWVAVAVVAVLVVGGVFRGGADRKKLRLDEFETRIASGQVKNATAHRGGTPPELKGAVAKPSASNTCLAHKPIGRAATAAENALC